MSCCAIDAHFGRERAEDDLARYREVGPEGTARMLLELLPADAWSVEQVLDIGGGVGALALELLGRNAERATLVEISSAYLEVAAAEAARRRLAERLRCVHGDAAILGEKLPAAELVTLDRVVCCYPDVAALLAAATGCCRRWLALSYPRDHWPARLGFALENRGRHRRGDAFTTYIHRERLIHALLTGYGLVRRARQSTLLWRVALYERPTGTSRTGTS